MTKEFKPEKISDIEVGDIVLLQWDGYEVRSQRENIT